MNELTTLRPDAQPADIFFGQEPVKSDWPAIIAAVESGEYTTATCLAALAELEPVEISSIHSHRIFVLQQTLRLCLRKAKDKPLLSKKTCATCGTNKLDEVHEECLACAEEDHQTGYYGSRGSCRYTKPCYDPVTNSWGVLFYEAHYGSHEAVYMFWVSLGWKTRREVVLAMYPLTLFQQWVDRELNGLGDADPHYFYRLSNLMKQTLPFTPAAFETYTKEVINHRMANVAGQCGFDTRIEWALREYESNQRRQQ